MVRAPVRAAAAVALIAAALGIGFAAEPLFWESKPPEAWTDDEINTLLSASPWSQLAGTAPVFLASAKPVREAEAVAFKRAANRGERDSGEEDYRQYIEKYPGKHIVLAVRAGIDDLADPKEVKYMEKECYLRIGKKKVRMVGHFPPTPADPYLRMLFPRVPLEGLKVLSFGLYLPGILKPFRDARFFLDDLKYRGQVEY